ncbi:anti-phage dCTP deaminase [Marinobacter alexandrii]|jgi:deoxycytidylate deaminase|uniref:anti-phage dCTP deaminase n=1 Tax=Marinobacter alexandrii TaxID=2570351 RepID=UPI002ABE8855|nr:anti-phage dCTP deaminase [Marinobacter alexandrii]
MPKKKAVKPVSRASDSPFSYPGLDPLEPSGSPELMIGIVGPAGVDRSKICGAVGAELSHYGYTTKTIKLSSLIQQIPNFSDSVVDGMDEADRIGRLMDAGNNLRKLSKHGDALAILAISEIVQVRAALNKADHRPEDSPREKTAYILDSLKHPEEISTLRAAYGQGFILISSYSSRDNRVSNLAKRISKSRHQPQGTSSARASAETLINRDEKEENEKYGQNVQSCFPKADFFINLDSPRDDIKSQLERYFEVVFDNPFITPSKDEWGMFHAEAAAWRSADLARQVGSAVCSDDGALLAVGCNEVPKANGGLYWEGDIPDGRDFRKGIDKGAEHKRLMLAEVFHRLKDEGKFDKKAKKIFNDLIQKSMDGEEDPVLEGLQALNVIEYGRTVHAEMAALMDAVSRGVSVSGATMYVNTYPCHICARHIISAGIKRLVYVEPYPKSLSSELFSDSICSDRSTWDDTKVLFQSFTGVAPRAYRFSFKLVGKRKHKSGEVLNWSKSKARTKLKRYVTSYMAVEHQVTGGLLPRILKNLKGIKK